MDGIFKATLSLPANACGSEHNGGKNATVSCNSVLFDFVMLISWFWLYL